MYEVINSNVRCKNGKGNDTGFRLCDVAKIQPMKGGVVITFLDDFGNQWKDVMRVPYRELLVVWQEFLDGLEQG